MYQMQNFTFRKWLNGDRVFSVFKKIYNSTEYLTYSKRCVVQPLEWTKENTKGLGK
jgi:hypothetical protein